MKKSLTDLKRALEDLALNRRIFHAALLTRVQEMDFFRKLSSLGGT